jgi:hypothetical protein
MSHSDEQCDPELVLSVLEADKRFILQERDNANPRARDLG